MSEQQTTRNGASAPGAAGAEAQKPGAGAAEQSVAQELSEIEGTERQLEALQKDLAEYKEHLLRKSADFENFKKRVERDKAQWIAFANEKLLLALLPVLDDLERSLAAGKDSHAGDSFYAGVLLIHQKFLGVLRGAGVEPIESVGAQFNVELHEALLQMPSAAAAPGTILEEALRGYMLGGKVLRHARVVVAAPPEAQQH